MEDKTLQSTSPLGAIDMMGTITAVHLVLIALFAIAAVAIIVWGTKRWRANKQAMAELEADGRLETVDPEAPATPPATIAEPTPETPQPVERQAEPAVAPIVAPPLETIPQPVAPPPPPIVAPQAEMIVPRPTSPPIAQADNGDLTRLKGLGPKVAARLAELNVTRIADLAALDDAQAADLDAQLGNFKGRMARDKWIEQARLLDAGDVVGYEAQFGKLG